MMLFKKLLSALLIITTVLCTSVSVFAQSENTTDIMAAAAEYTRDDIQIAKPPQSMKAKYGENFTFSVEVSAPEELEIRYQWYTGKYYQNGKIIDGATESVLVLTPDTLGYPEETDLGFEISYVFCEITIYKDGRCLYDLKRNTPYAEAITDFTFKGALRNIFVLPWESAYMLAATTFFYSFGVLIPFVPLAFVFGFFEGVCASALNFFKDPAK